MNFVKIFILFVLMYLIFDFIFWYISNYLYSPNIKSNYKRVKQIVETETKYIYNYIFLEIDFELDEHSKTYLMHKETIFHISMGGGVRLGYNQVKIGYIDHFKIILLFYKSVIKSSKYKKDRMKEL